MLINGLPGNTINANDRGLMYGDGVFRTILLRHGHPVNWQRQYQKLQHDCNALGIACPVIQLLEQDLSQLIATDDNAVLKIIITRGISARGYAPQANAEVTRIVSVNALPEYPASYAEEGIKIQVCNFRLGHQPRLAGIKHLNRLENVMAAAELTQPEFVEGIMLDIDDRVIECTRSNIFIVQDGKLHTPALALCGVAGLQRELILELAKARGLHCEIREIKLAELQAADEIFVVNSIIGLWPVREMPGYKRTQFPVSHQIQAWLHG